MSEKAQRPSDSGRDAPFDRNPWPGESGYEPLKPPRPAGKFFTQGDPHERQGDSGENDLASGDPIPGDPVPVESEQSVPAAASIESEHVEGEFQVPPGYRTIEGSPFGGGASVAVVVSRFNGRITSALLANALTELERLGVRGEAITIMPVPGAFELPLAAMALSKSRRFSCVIALGCVIRGETPHFEYVAGEAASGIMLAGLETGVPVSFGVLTVDTVEQAEARLTKGAEAARAALEMADAFGRLRAVAGG